MSRPKFEYCERMKDIAEEMIEKVPEFECIREAQPRIAFLMSNQKKKSRGVLVYGDCEKVKPKMQAFTNFDYIITFYEKNIEHLDSDQIEILMMHELYHIDCSREEDGSLTCNVRPHDIQEFSFISDKYGVAWDR